MDQLLKLAGQLDPGRAEGYLCREEPGKRKDDTTGNIKIVTVKTQIRIRDPQGNETEVWSPTLYQSCMNPQRIELRPLYVEICPGGGLRIGNSYGSRTLDLERCILEAAPWVPKIHKTDCRHCENCGRCSW